MAKKTTTTTKKSSSKKENDVKIETKITDETTSTPVNPEESKAQEEVFTTPPTVVELARQIRSAEDLMKFGEDDDVCEREVMNEALKILNDIANDFDNANALKDYREVYLKKYSIPIERNVDSDINALLGILVNKIKNERNAECIEKLTSENYDKLFAAFKNALYLSEILLSKPIRSDTPVDNTIPRMHGYAEYEGERWENDTVEVSVKVHPRLSLITDCDDNSTYILRYTPSIVRSVVMKSNREAEPEVRVMVPGEVVVKFSTLNSKIKYSVNSNGITEEFGNIFDIFKHVTYLEEKMNRLNCITCQKRCKVPDCCFLYEDKVFARRRNDRGEEMAINLTAKIKNGNVKVSKKIIDFLRVNEFVKEDILCFVQTRLSK